MGRNKSSLAFVAMPEPRYYAGGAGVASLHTHTYPMRIVQNTRTRRYWLLKRILLFGGRPPSCGAGWSVVYVGAVGGLVDQPYYKT